MSCNERWLNRITTTAGLALAGRTLLLSACMLFSACATQDALPDQAEETPAEAPVRSQFAEAVRLKKDGQLPQAEARFLALSQSQPGLSGPLANLGIIALERGEPAKAEAYFKQVIALKPAHPHALNGLGVLARERGAFSEAEAHYRAALKADANFQPALRNLAILLELYQGRMAEALALVERYQALQTEPDSALKDWIFDLKSRMSDGKPDDAQE